MKTIKQTLLLAIAFLSLSIAFAQDNTYKLTVIVVDLENSTGKVMISLLDGNQNTVAEKETILNDNTCSFEFDNLTPGVYAVKYIHDENLNGKLDMGMFGPKEGYGFSNDARGSFGPPDFEDQVFNITDKDITLTLHTAN